MRDIFMRECGQAGAHLQEIRVATSTTRAATRTTSCQHDRQVQGRGLHHHRAAGRPDPADPHHPRGHPPAVLPRVVHRRHRACRTRPPSPASTTRSSGATPSGSHPCGSRGAGSRSPPATASSTTACPACARAMKACSSTSTAPRSRRSSEASTWPARTSTTPRSPAGLYAYPPTGGKPASPLVWVSRQFPTEVKDWSEVWYDPTLVGPDERSETQRRDDRARRRRQALQGGPVADRTRRAAPTR